MLGLTQEEAEEADVVEVWPDNVESVNAFIALGTQWQVGPGGAIGLVYASIEPVLRFNKVPRKNWPDVFEDIRVLEDAALEQQRRS